MGRDAKAFIVKELEFPGRPGAVQFVYSQDKKVIGWNHSCPCGCGSWSYMGFDSELNTKAATWQVVSGNLNDLEHLTLAPSIGIKPKIDSGYHWHGWLENGVFIEK